MQLTRRKLFIKSLMLMFYAPIILVQACKKNKPKDSTIAFTSCTDLDGIPEADLLLRKQLAYVAESPLEDNTCGNCNLWLLPKASLPCGGCTLFAGPVATAGYCTYWAPIAESSQ